MSIEAICPFVRTEIAGKDSWVEKVLPYTLLAIGIIGIVCAEYYLTGISRTLTMAGGCLFVALFIIIKCCCYKNWRGEIARPTVSTPPLSEEKLNRQTPPIPHLDVSHFAGARNSYRTPDRETAFGTPKCTTRSASLWEIGSPRNDRQTSFTTPPSHKTPTAPNSTETGETAFATPSPQITPTAPSLNSSRGTEPASSLAASPEGNPETSETGEVFSPKRPEPSAPEEREGVRLLAFVEFPSASQPNFNPIKIYDLRLKFRLDGLKLLAIRNHDDLQSDELGTLLLNKQIPSSEGVFELKFTNKNQPGGKVYTVLLIPTGSPIIWNVSSTSSENLTLLKKALTEAEIMDVAGLVNLINGTSKHFEIVSQSVHLQDGRSGRQTG